MERRQTVSPRDHSYCILQAELRVHYGKPNCTLDKHDGRDHIIVKAARGNNTR